MKAQSKPALELTPEEIAQLEASYAASTDFEEIKSAPQAAQPGGSPAASEMDLEATIDIIDFAADDVLEIDALQADALLSTLIKPET